MGNFNRFDKGRSGRGGFGGGPRRFGGHGGGPKQMFSATCTECGDDCQVPFRPTGDRPVLCNNCFKKDGGPSPRFAQKSFGGSFRRESTGSSGFDRRSTPVSNGVTKADFEALNLKLEKIMTMLFALSSPSQNLKAEPKSVEKEVKAKKLGAKKVKTPAKKVKAKK